MADKTDRERVEEYLFEITNGMIGTGEDPVGFLIASHAMLRHELKTHRDAVQTISEEDRQTFRKYLDDNSIFN